MIKRKLINIFHLQKQLDLRSKGSKIVYIISLLVFAILVFAGLIYISLFSNNKQFFAAFFYSYFSLQLFFGGIQYTQNNWIPLNQFSIYPISNFQKSMILLANVSANTRILLTFIPIGVLVISTFSSGLFNVLYLTSALVLFFLFIELLIAVIFLIPSIIISQNQKYYVIIFFLPFLALNYVASFEKIHYLEKLYPFNIISMIIIYLKSGIHILNGLAFLLINVFITYLIIYLIFVIDSYWKIFKNETHL